MKPTQFTFTALLLFCCIQWSNSLQAQKNPAAVGFDEAGSDVKAIQIADRAMDAMGGRKNWDKTRFLAWNFFGARKWVWDKWTGDVRMDNQRDDLTVLMNVNTGKGRVYKFGKEQTAPDSLAKYLKSAKSGWINDSYWLVMPYKLKDSGVTLKYLGEEKTQDNKDADVIQLTFKSVGDTPNNKYKVWVDKQTNLVWQWAYFPKADAEKPGFVRPWTDYQKMGKIMLSGERGDRDLTDIQVMDKIPSEILTDFKRP
jgi:hypothetical protein